VEAPFLSLILPAHNEERRLLPALQAVHRFLSTQTYTAEVLVVENGSQDDTLSIARGAAETFPEVQVLHEERRGKGLAVRRGMLAARGAYRFFCDVDFSMPVEEINLFLPPKLDAEVAIASREVPGARRIGEPLHRHVVGRAFNTLVRALLLPDLHDTQCGFKCFRGDVAEEVFSLQRLDGMSFDAEVLYIARLHGHRIEEVPIPWIYNPDSRVRLVEDSLGMARDLLAIRRNARQGLYG
jgi:glycosyltransferase involved in cell wall biosynthesis